MINFLVLSAACLLPVAAFAASRLASVASTSSAAAAPKINFLLYYYALYENGMKVLNLSIL